MRKYSDRAEYLRAAYKKWYASHREEKKEAERKKAAKNKLKYLEWKETLSCSKCGETASCCLELHHLDPKTKDIAVSQLASKSLKRILKEAEKCIVLCSNCHKKLHWELIH